MKKILLAISGLLVLVLTLHCASIGQSLVAKPKVGLDTVKLGDVSGNGATVLFGLKVDNPNPFALKVDGLRYDVDIGGKAFSSGRIDKPLEVPAKAASVIEIPVPVKYSDVFSSLLDLVQNNQSTYRVKGEALFGVLSIPFDEKGEMKLRP